MLSKFSSLACVKNPSRTGFRPLFVLRFLAADNQAAPVWAETAKLGFPAAEAFYYTKRAAGTPCHIRLWGWLVRGEYVSLADATTANLPSNHTADDRTGELPNLVGRMQAAAQEISSCLVDC